MDELVVLLPSPLGGPDSWGGVAAQLRERGIETAIANPALDEQDPEPLWSQQASAVASAVEVIASRKRLVLVGHSGATAILPAVGERLGKRVAAYVLVDGPLAEAGRSQLDMMRMDMPSLASVVERTLAAGRLFPDAQAQKSSSQVAGSNVAARPRGRRFFDEPVRVPATWPGAPCAYVALGIELGPSGARARELGWPTRRLGGHHFLMISDPHKFTDALVELMGELVLRPAVRRAE